MMAWANPRLRERTPEAIHVLIVDDDDVDRERIVRRLREYPVPATLVEADSLAQARALIDENVFDAVIVDGHLGDGEGTDLVPAVARRYANACPVILVTGFGSERDAVAAMRTGVYDYIPKHALEAGQLAQVIANGIRWGTAQIQLQQAEEQLKRRSLYDMLTELPNRSLFFDRLEQACANHHRNQLPFTVMMMDLDRFKAVNDTLGHAAGDQVLQQVARRLSGACRETDTISRLGGDEFAAILPGVGSLEAVQNFAAKLIDALRPPVIIDEHPLSIGLSIGAALCPDHGADPAGLLSVADKAMYQAKAGPHSVICTPVSDGPTPSKLPPQVLLHEIDRAIDRNEFEMFYQPKIDLVSNRVVGAEALMRWRTPDGTLVLPDAFIPVVERSSLLTKFTLMSFRTVMEQMAEWAGRGIELEVAVNLSSRMLEDADLGPQLLRLLEIYSIPARLLTLEITETALILNPARARAVIDQLRSLGIKLSIDDFGAGFTSFLYLKSFGVPEIKIDKAYIIDLEPNSFSASLVRCISVFCQAQGIRLVAEGLERPENRSLLCELGCTIGQGFSIAAPQHADGFESWLRTTGYLDTQAITPAGFGAVAA